jgi:hypothetical protein
VTAVMLEREQPNEQSSGWQSAGQRCPTIAVDAIVEGRHEDQERQSGVEDLGHWHASCRGLHKGQ